VPLPPTSLAPASAASAVADTLRRAIVSGELLPGEQLTQEEVARQLDVSRQPVREAIRLLKAEALLVEGAGRSTVVRSYSTENIQENFFLRSILEGEAARFAAQRMSAEELEELQRIHLERRLIIESGLIHRALDLNRQFHSLIRKCARMATMERIIDDLAATHMAALPETRFMPPGRLEESQREHIQLLEALTERDSDGAAAAMKTHILQGQHAYIVWRAELSPVES
jgi:DNA-binding GntR family transcriptional regulator